MNTHVLLYQKTLLFSRARFRERISECVTTAPQYQLSTYDQRWAHRHNRNNVG